MTFRDLQKLVQSQSIPEQSQLLLRLRDKQFWYWDQTRHKEKDRAHKGNCCFNHIIGLPKKDGKRKPIFDYEAILYKALLQQGYLNSNPSGIVVHPFKEKHVSAALMEYNRSET